MVDIAPGLKTPVHTRHRRRNGYPTITEAGEGTGSDDFREDEEYLRTVIEAIAAL